MLRAAAAFVVALASVVGRADVPPFNDQVIAGATHRDGPRKWTDQLVRAASYACSNAKSGADGAIDCVLNTVRVRNESDGPLQCHVTLELSRKDDNGNRHVEGDLVVFPGSEFGGPASYGPAALKTRRFTSKCVAIPDVMAPLPAVAQCRGQISAPSPDDFFPPGSKRRREEGDVILEYGVKRGSTDLYEVLVVASSHFEELDNAALELAKQVEVRDQCPNRRYRFKVRFVIRD